MMAAAYVMVVLEQNALVAVVVCLLIGVVVGLINGFLIVYMRVPDLLATLGMMFLLVGLQRIPTEGRSIATGMTMPDGSVANGTFSAGFLALGRHRFDFFIPNLIPVSVVVLLVLAVLIWFFLEYTRFGRMMYAVGSNRGRPNSPARLSRHTKSGPMSFQGFLPQSAAFCSPPGLDAATSRRVIICCWIQSPRPSSASRCSARPSRMPSAPRSARCSSACCCRA